jgi:hypothetical protein
MNIDTAIKSLLEMCALWIVTYYVWPDFRHDAFREDIFSVRDEMFLFAAQGNIIFDNPAYTILRERMNALLRHGHDLTITRMTLILITHRGMKHELSDRWEAAIAELPEQTQAKMREFSLRVTIFVLQHVVYYSFFRYMVVRPFMFLVEVRTVIKSPQVVSGVERLESEALEQETYSLGGPLTA